MTDQALAHTEEVRQLFDAKAASWAAKYAPQGRLTGRLTQLSSVVSYHVPAGGRVLDLGCGTRGTCPASGRLRAAGDWL